MVTFSLLDLAFLSSSPPIRLERYIYHEISLPNPHSVSLFVESARLRKDDGFYTRTVRKLTIDMETNEETYNIIALCAGLKSIVLLLRRRPNHPPGEQFRETPDLRHMRSLKHLSAMDPYIVECTHLPPSITHISIIRTTTYLGTVPETLMELLSGCPSITHFMYGVGHYANDNTDMFNLIRELKERPCCPRLRMLIIVCGYYGLMHRRDPHDLAVEFERMQDMEPRIVVVNTDQEYFGRVKNMLDVDLSKEDVWEAAERCMENRSVK